jgi:hypothetical protein
MQDVVAISIRIRIRICICIRTHTRTGQICSHFGSRHFLRLKGPSASPLCRTFLLAMVKMNITLTLALLLYVGFAVAEDTSGTQTMTMCDNQASLNKCGLEYGKAIKTQWSCKFGETSCKMCSILLEYDACVQKESATCTAWAAGYAKKYVQTAKQQFANICDPPCTNFPELFACGAAWNNVVMSGFQTCQGGEGDKCKMCGFLQTYEKCLKSELATCSSPEAQEENKKLQTAKSMFSGPCDPACSDMDKVWLDQGTTMSCRNAYQKDIPQAGQSKPIHELCAVIAKYEDCVQKATGECTGAVAENAKQEVENAQVPASWCPKSSTLYDASAAGSKEGHQQSAAAPWLPLAALVAMGLVGLAAMLVLRIKTRAAEKEQEPVPANTTPVPALQSNYSEMEATSLLA